MVYRKGHKGYKKQKEKAIGEIINIGTDKETKIIDLARKINGITGNKEIRYIERRDWDTIKRRKAPIEKAKEILGYEPKIELDEGLKKTYGWFKEKSNYPKK